jgi:hypothetical protein
MTTKPRRPMGGLPGPAQPSGDTSTAKRPAGRPTGVPSTIVNVRLPLPLVAELDRYLARLERQTGLKANRGMSARRALELFLAAPPFSGAAKEGERGVLSSRTGIVAHKRRRYGQLSHITEARSTGPPDRRFAKREKLFLA